MTEMQGSGEVKFIIIIYNSNFFFKRVLFCII